MRRIVEEALEAEAADALGRGYYQRQAGAAGDSTEDDNNKRSGGNGHGYRNGYRIGHLKSAEGSIDFAVPQISDRERLNPGQRRDAVLAAWGIDHDGRKHLLHLCPGTKEDTESCVAFIQDLKRRGLKDPPLVSTDGAGGLIAAVNQCFPRSLRQRCLVHKMRNLSKKVIEKHWPTFKADASAVYQAPNPETARLLRDEFVERCEKKYPTANR